MKTIIYIGGFILPDKNAAAHRVVSNAKIFRDLGYRVILIGVSKEDPEYFHEISSSYENIEMYSVPYPKSMVEWFKYLFDNTSIKKALNLYNEINYFIFYNYQSFAFLLAKNRLRKNNVKLISDCTEWYGTPEGGFFKRVIKNTDTWLRMYLIQKNQVDGLIVISKYLNSFYKNQKKILLPPLIDKKEEKWVTEKNHVCNEVKFVYAGQPGDSKDNLGKIIKALYNIQPLITNQFKFDVIGINEEQFRQTYNFDHNINKIANFHGRVEHKVAIEMVKKANFMIFYRDKSRVTQAGFPTKFVESITCGAPVITNESSNISDFLKEAINGFILPESQLEIEEKLISIINTDKAIILEMKENCLKENIFDYRNYLHAMKDFLNHL